MSYFCPVCNGMRRLVALCPKCGQSSNDFGRSDDYLGAYSPYRPIDELKLTNGFMDLMHRECVHIVQCDRCGYSFHHSVQELCR